MDVKSLVEYYNNINNATTQASIASAGNQTSANIKSAELGMEAKRLAQEKQLEFFKQKMESMREARRGATQEKISLANIQATSGQGILDKQFTAEQNALQREANIKENAVKREFEEPLQTAQIANYEESAKESQVKREQAGQIQTKDLLDTYKDFLGQKKEGILWDSGNDKKRNIMIQSLEKQLSERGVDVNSNPDVLDAKKPEVEARYKELLTSVPDYFKNTVMDSKKSTLQEKWSLLTAKIANGAIPQSKVKDAVSKFANLAKSYGVKAEDLGIE